MSDHADREAIFKPKRIRLERTKGWRKPEGAVVVSRPTKWGNPFRYRTPYGLARTPAIDGEGDWEFEGRISADGARHDYHHPGGKITVCHVRYMTLEECVELYRAALTRRPTPSMQMAYPSGSFVKPTIAEAVLELAGHDLACWCSLNSPCHADVLLELANGGTS